MTTTTIDKVKTGQQIRLLMEKHGVTVKDVKNALPQFKDMLRGILHAGATKEQALDYVRELLDELDDE